MLVDGWVDVHAHFYPPEGEEQIQARWEAMKQACWTSPEPPRWDPLSTLAYMDRSGIAMQMLSNVPKKLRALRTSNKYGASLVKDHPARFGLLAALPTNTGRGVGDDHRGPVWFMAQIAVCPCTTDATMDANLEALRSFTRSDPGAGRSDRLRALQSFPAAAERMSTARS